MPKLLTYFRNLDGRYDMPQGKNRHWELRMLRDQAGWSQKEFADQLGITSNHYARLERGDIRGGVRMPIALSVLYLARLIVKLKLNGIEVDHGEILNPKQLKGGHGNKERDD